MKQGNRNSKAGFSMVEVVMALGIIAFTVIPIIGLNAASLVVLREARAQEVSSRIFRSVLNEARAADFSDLGGLVGQRFYDREGSYLGGVVTSEAVYQAVIAVGAAEIIDSAEPIVLDDALRISVEVYKAEYATPETMVSKRFVVVGNRMKSLGN